MYFTCYVNGTKLVEICASVIKDQNKGHADFLLLSSILIP